MTIGKINSHLTAAKSQSVKQPVSKVDSSPIFTRKLIRSSGSFLGSKNNNLYRLEINTTITESTNHVPSETELKETLAKHLMELGSETTLETTLASSNIVQLLTKIGKCLQSNQNNQSFLDTHLKTIYELEELMACLESDTSNTSFKLKPYISQTAVNIKHNGAFHSVKELKKHYDNGYTPWKDFFTQLTIVANKNICSIEVLDANSTCMPIIVDPTTVNWTVSDEVMSKMKPPQEKLDYNTDHNDALIHPPTTPSISNPSNQQITHILAPKCIESDEKPNPTNQPWHEVSREIGLRRDDEMVVTPLTEEEISYLAGPPSNTTSMAWNNETDNSSVNSSLETSLTVQAPVPFDQQPLLNSSASKEIITRTHHSQPQSYQYVIPVMGSIIGMGFVATQYNTNENAWTAVWKKTTPASEFLNGTATTAGTFNQLDLHSNRPHLSIDLVKILSKAMGNKLPLLELQSENVSSIDTCPVDSDSSHFLFGLLSQYINVSRLPVYAYYTLLMISLVLLFHWLTSNTTAPKKPVPSLSIKPDKVSPKPHEATSTPTKLTPNQSKETPQGVNELPDLLSEPKLNGVKRHIQF